MNRKVLIIDDSPIARRQVKNALGDEDFEIIEATNGREGVEKLSTMTVALVILDVNMPGMSGIEMLAHLRDVPAKPPIVMLTSEADPDLVAEGRRLGASGWMLKPFKADLLLATAKKLIG